MSGVLHYEKIKDAADDELRSVRIDQDYRGIVLSPAQGNAHVLLWVAKHDDTYTWAARHTCRIHPETGSLQPMETVPDQAQALEVPPARAASREPLFNLRDRELPHVMDWIAQQRSSDLFLSVITLGEIERAIAQQRSQNPSLRATLLRNPATVAG